MIETQEQRGTTYCVLLCGLPGSGKTHLSYALAEHGFTRICPDEEMFRRHGRYGPDFPRGEYKVRERPILQDVSTDLRKSLTEGQDVVLDHGLWTPEERAEWKALVTDSGATPVSVHLPAPHEVRWERIRRRNQHADADANSIFFSEEDLLRFAGRFHPPGPAEPHVVYDGDPGTVLSVVNIAES